VPDSSPDWHPRVARGLAAVARLAGPTDGAMNLLTATRAILNREHKRALIREIRRALAAPTPADGADADARRDLSLFLAILPTAPVPIRFAD
jgi:hypothetical protein